MVRTLRFLEARINALMDAWTEPGEARPRRAEGTVLPFSAAPADPMDIDIVVDRTMDAFAEAPVPVETVTIDDTDDEIGFEELPAAREAAKRSEPAAPPPAIEAEPEPAHRVASSLAELDAMPTTQKALIFG